MTGAMLNFAVANASAAGTIGSSMTFALGQGAVFFGTAWGLVAWREFKDAPAKAKALLTGAFLFFAAGMIAVFSSQVNPR